MELLDRKQSLEKMCKDRRYTKMEGGREKHAAAGEVTGAAGSRSRAPDMEAGRLPAQVVLATKEDEQVLPMEEAVDNSQKSKEIEDIAAVKAAQDTDMEGGFVICEIGQ